MRSARFALVLALTAVLSVDVIVRLGALETRETQAQQGPAADGRERRRDAIVRAVEKTGPAVANIATERVIVERFPPSFDEFFREFGGRGTERRSLARSLGSGVIIDPQGYIVTNAHVVQRASKIVVTLPDEREFEANLLSLNNVQDLALLKIETGAPLPFVRLGTSSDLMPGETVIALGNPFGLENTVTRGVISARDRRIKKDGKELEGTFLQTDAAINPGNSGGPLVNIDAELIGVNTAVHAGGQGIGFAIPVDRVRSVLDELSDPEPLLEVWMGWKLEDSRDGVRVTRVDAGSPAALAGVVAGDVVESAGSARTTSVFEVHKQGLSPEKSLSVTLRGASGARRSVAIAKAVSPAHALVERRLGIAGRDLTPAIAWKNGLETEQGILIGNVTAGGPAARIGVEAGDVVVKLGRHLVDPRLGQSAWEISPVAGSLDLAQTLDKIKKGDEIAVFVLRKGRELQGELRVD